MTEILNGTVIMEHMASGATLYRDAGNVELRLPDGRIAPVPLHIFDGLIEERRIVQVVGGLYRLC